MYASPMGHRADSDSESDSDDLADFGMPVPTEHHVSTGDEESSTGSDSTEVIYSNSRRGSRRSSLGSLAAVSEATRTSFLQHVQAAISVVFGAHVRVDSDEEEQAAAVQNNLSDTAKRLLGPLGQMKVVDSAQKEFESLRGLGLKYHTMHHTFWANFALAFWLGFWIAFIGLPNYALTARKFIYGDTQETAALLQARDNEWTHYWCDLSESGLSESDLTNITDCSTTNALEQADFKEQGFLNDTQRGGSATGKICGYRPGRRYYGQYKRFWIGSASGNYFPTIDGRKPVYIEESNGTDVQNEILADGGSKCLQMCEKSQNCSVWSWHSYSNGRIYGGICHFFGDLAVIDTRLMYDWQKWIGGTCMSNAKTNFYCPASVYGRYHNYAPITQEPDLRPWESSMTHSASSDLWCGVLPESWADTWPNVVQMVVFSVFGGTGTTLQLCWQGFIGTSCACFNAFLMGVLFPQGGKGEECSEAQVAQGLCQKGDWLYASVGYRSWIGWLDTLGVLFLFMLSNSQINTIKFGMSWHFFFMMDFINPKTGRKACPDVNTVFFGLICYSEYWFVVFVTTILGCLFAVIVTFVPCPLFNQRKAHSEMATVSKTVSAIWRESVDYFCGNQQTPQRYRIEARIDAIADLEMTIQSNLQAAWWESALLCRYDLRRWELLVIQQNLQDIFDVLPAVKWCVLHEDFQGDHKEFIGDLQPHLQALVVEATELLELCIRAPYARGTERESMNRYIQESAFHVQKLQHFLVKAYRKKRLKLNADLADETTLIFALSFTARKAADLSKLICEEKKSWACWRGDNLKLLVEGCWEGFKNTWNPSLMLSHDHLTFAVRNFVGIAVVFFLALTLQNYIFQKFSAVMPATLALLISQYQSTAFTNNLHRLLGVLLGKVLPLLILSGLSLMHCGNLRSLASFFSIWIYVTFFSYMYYTSATWSLVGCLVAGFGVYPLLQPCITASLSGEILEMRYAELGQITMALAVQMLVDTVLKRSGPADVAVLELRRLLQCIFIGWDGHLSGLEAIHRSSLPELQLALKEAELSMSRAKALSTEADPKQRIMAGPHTPFKIELYRSALDVLQGCMTCLNLVIISEKVWAVNMSVRDEGDEEEFGSNPEHSGMIAYSSAENHSMLEIAMESFATVFQKSFTPDRILETATHVSRSLEAILRHRIEAKLEDEFVAKLDDIQLLDSHFDTQQLDSWLAEVSEKTWHIRTDKHELTNNLQARLVVGARTIAQLHYRLAELHSLCLKSNLF